MLAPMDHLRVDLRVSHYIDMFNEMKRLAVETRNLSRVLHDPSSNQFAIHLPLQ